MKKHLSKIIITALILLAITSSMIFAGSLLTKLPTFKGEFLYTLGTENPVFAVMVEDADMDLTETMLEEYIKEKFAVEATVSIAESTVQVDAVTYDLVIFGDVDNDGVIDIADALVVLKDVVDVIEPLEGRDLLAANLDNTDDVLDIGDVLRLLKLIVGVDTEALAEEYTNDLTMTHTLTPAADSKVSLHLEFNMNVEDLLELAYPDAAIMLNEKEITEDLNSNENVAVLEEAQLIDGTNTVQVLSYYEPENGNNPAEYGEVLAELEFDYAAANLVEFDGNIAITVEEKNISMITKDHETVDFAVNFTGEAKGSFELTFEVYKDDSFVEENLIQPAGNPIKGTISDGTVAFSADVTGLKDGWVRVIVTYVADNNYEAEIEAVIEKNATEIKLVSAEIERIDADSKTNITLLLTFEDACAELISDLDSIILPYEEEEAPEEPTVEEIEAAGLVGDVEAITENMVEVTYLEIDPALEEENKLFFVLDGEIYGYDVPAELPALAGVHSVTFGDDLKASWDANSADAEYLTGYRVYLYNGADVVYTEVLKPSVTSIALDEKIKAYAEESESVNLEYTVAVISLGDNENARNSVEKEASVTLVETTLVATSVAFGEDNAKNIVLTFEGELEDIEEAIEYYTTYVVDLYKDGDTSEPAATVPFSVTTLVETEEEDVYTTTLDLKDHMDEYGVWEATLTVEPEEVSKYLASDPVEVDGEYVNARIKSVEKEVTNEAAAILVEIEGAEDLDLKASYTDASSNKRNLVETASGNSATIDLEDVKAGKEYAVKVELLLGDVVLDTENVTVKLDSLLTLAKGEELTRGEDSFEVTDTEIIIEGEPYEKEEIANATFLANVYAMLKDGDSVLINAEGNKVAGIQVSAYDNEDVEVRNLTLDKKLLENEVIISSGMEMLILKGTANDIILYSYAVDIQGLKAGLIDVTEAYCLRVSGAVNPDDVSGDMISADPVDPYTKFTVDGYDYEFITRAVTMVALQDGYIMFYSY